MTIDISQDVFGEAVDPKNGKAVSIKRYSLQNKNGISVHLITLGATIQSINVPDKNGSFATDIVLGFDNPEGYQSNVNPYFGCTVGRVANRIRNGHFVLDGKSYELAKNLNNLIHLHGGNIGFDKVVWNSYVARNKVIFTYLSPDGEEGYPGDLLVTVTYQLTNENRLYVTFEAVTTKSTPVNLTNHSYFNLAGHDSGPDGLYDHDICINADHITELDDLSVPTGKLLDVEGTTYDLRNQVNLGQMIKSRQNEGYDHNFCLNERSFAAKVIHPASGRYLEVHTNSPGVQFYTGNFLPKAIGKRAAYFEKHGAFCLETQKFPDSVNIDSFPDTILRPGEQYKHTVIYKFGVISNEQ